MIIPSGQSRQKTLQPFPQPKLIRKISTRSADAEFSIVILTCGQQLVLVTSLGDLRICSITSGKVLWTRCRNPLGAIPVGTTAKASEVIFFALAGAASSLIKLDARDNKTLRKVPLGLRDGDQLLPRPRSSGDVDKIVALCVSEDNKIWIYKWDDSLRQQRQLLQRISPAFFTEAYDLSACGNAAAIASREKLFVWELSDRATKPRQRVLETAHEDPIIALCFSSHGDRLCARFYSGRLSIFCRGAAEELSRSSVPSSVCDTAFSPKGDLLFLSTADGHIVVRDVLTGSNLYEFVSSSSGGCKLMPHPDGRRLITVHRRVVKIWQLPVSIRSTGDPRGGSSGELRADWRRLGSRDGRIGVLALAKLQKKKAATLGLLEAELHLNEGLGGKIKGCVARLASKQFSVRERATDELRDLGWIAQPYLEKRLIEEKDAEVARRLRGLLREFSQGPRENVNCLRVFRAVQLLEHMGTTRAKACLRQISQFHNVSIAYEARASLERLEKQAR
jgi:WD40 repeat protein